MKIRQSIFRRGKTGGDIGRIVNTWTLRLTHTDEIGSKTSKTWQYATKQDAKDDIENRKAELISFIETKGLDLGDIKTFREWAEFAKSDFYRPAVIMEGRKVAGIKSHRQTHVLIDQLVECFGDKLLAKFSKYDLDRYKVWRLEQGDLRGKKGKLAAKERNAVKLSTVNRGLAILKHLLIEAHDVGLIAKNVTKGSKAIDADAETARTRTLTDDEEMRLLAACGGPRIIEYERKGKKLKAEIDATNPYLKVMILLGLDSGLRRGEILKLDWQDIDFDKEKIILLGTNTKTQRPRPAPLSSRTKATLMELANFNGRGKILPFKDFKRSWATALRLAKIDGLRFHDLRRTFMTRNDQNGVSLATTAKLAGHSRIETTQKHYISIDDDSIIQDVTAKINAANDARLKQWPDTIE